MKILFTTPILQHIPLGGPQLRIENTIKALNRLTELHIVSRVSRREIGGKSAEVFFKKHSSVFNYIPYINVANNRIAHKLAKYWKHFFYKDDAAFLVEYANNHGIEIIWFGYGNISYDLMKEIKRIAPKKKLICDTDSVWSRFVLRGLPYTKNISQRKQIERQGHIKQLEEAAWTNFCDVTTAVSHVDAEYYRNLTQDPGKIHLFSNVIDINNYLIKSPAPDGFLKPCIYLAGTFGSEESPMGHAAKWLIEEVLSLIKISIPNIRLYLVGNGSDEHFGDLNRADVIALGKVDSVLPYLCNADAALVPLFFESGTRFKIIEAAACGVPIVSTTLGAEGIPVQHGRDILIADTPQDFADAIIKLIVDKQFAAVLAKNCRELVIASNSVDALVEEAKCIINYLENFD